MPGTATLLGAFAVLTTRVSIDARDSDASTFWQTRFDVANQGYLPIYHVRYLCWFKELHAGKIQITDGRVGFAGVFLVPKLQPLDHFDAVCKSLEVGGVRADISNLEVVVAFTIFPRSWESISCANFVPETPSDTQIKWQRVGVERSQCKALIRTQESKFPTFR